jgi:hypothetical protein
MYFAIWPPFSALLIPYIALIPGLSLRSNPGLKLANAFGVNGQTLWLWLRDTNLLPLLLNSVSKNATARIFQSRGTGNSGSRFAGQGFSGLGDPQQDRSPTSITFALCKWCSKKAG